MAKKADDVLAAFFAAIEVDHGSSDGLREAAANARRALTGEDEATTEGTEGEAGTSPEAG